MPKCKNDSTRNYKGDEPSPKGLGFCAHAEDLGKQMKGKNKNIWEIVATKNGVKRWVEVNNKKLNNTKNKLIKKQKRGKKIETKSIIVYKNNKIFKKGNNLSVSTDKNNNNLIYLIFGMTGDKKKYQGRLYFRLNLLKGNKKDVIKNLKLNIKKQTFEFIYNGPWEDESTGELKIIKVNDKWKIVFNNTLDFNKVQKIVEEFKIVKIIE